MPTWVEATWVEESGSGCPEENRWAATIRKGDGWGASHITDVGGGEKKHLRNEMALWGLHDYLPRFLPRQQVEAQGPRPRPGQF